jgi:hypothetical protein
MGIDDEPEKIIKNPKEYAFRIYKIYNFSPLKRLDIKELSDFIIPPNDLYEKGITFKEYLNQNINKKIKLKIFSLLYRKIKVFEVEINDTINNKEGVLGCEMNYENFIKAQEKLLHVIKVKENTFAKDTLYLIENQDYIIGIKSLNDGKYYSINDENLNNLIWGFIEILNKNKGKECEFYIYNIKRGIKIILTKIPNDENFSLGCDVAYGKVHEFPKNIEELDEEKKTLK